MNEESKKSFFQTELLEWFEHNARDYPWRKTDDSYKILIAEIMLHRTRVNQVLPVYEKFIKKYADVQTLAKANLVDVSKYVSKLGMLWRSKLILDMAQTLINTYDGNIPENREELLKIEGIGDYTADAMISFAFNKKRIIIDSNVIRVVSRFFGIKETTGEMRRNKSFIEFCQTLTEKLSGEQTKKLNWAMIDHSASICKPNPLCNKCPLDKECNYFKGK